MLTMDARLGYTENVGQLHPNWTEVARSTEDRPLHCSVTKVLSAIISQCSSDSALEPDSLISSVFAISGVVSQFVTHFSVSCDTRSISVTSKYKIVTCNLSVWNNHPEVPM